MIIFLFSVYKNLYSDQNELINIVNSGMLQNKSDQAMMNYYYLFDKTAMTLTSQLHNKKGTITILTGFFDGVKLITDEDFDYPIPSNYISKSMLIPGDLLKLSIYSDGSMIYKLIKSAPRTHIRGIIHRKENQFLALGSNNLNYKLNSAAITFHKAQCGDEVCLVINEGSKHHYAALESIIKN